MKIKTRYREKYRLLINFRRISLDGTKRNKKRLSNPQTLWAEMSLMIQILVTSVALFKFRIVYSESIKNIFLSGLTGTNSMFNHSWNDTCV